MAGSPRKRARRQALLATVAPAEGSPRARAREAKSAKELHQLLESAKSAGTESEEWQLVDSITALVAAGRWKRSTTQALSRLWGLPAWHIRKLHEKAAQKALETTQSAYARAVRRALSKLEAANMPALVEMKVLAPFAGALFPSEGTTRLEVSGPGGSPLSPMQLMVANVAQLIGTPTAAELAHVAELGAGDCQLEGCRMHSPEVMRAMGR